MPHPAGPESLASQDTEPRTPAADRWLAKDLARLAATWLLPAFEVYAANLRLAEMLDDDEARDDAQAKVHAEWYAVRELAAGEACRLFTQISARMRAGAQR